MKKKLQLVLTFIISFLTNITVKAVGLYDTSYRPNTDAYTVIKSNHIFGLPPYKFVIFMIGVALLITSIIYLIKKKEKRFFAFLFLCNFLSLV